MRDEIRIKEERIFRKIQAEKGILPRSFDHRKIFLPAHSFLYAIDMFGKLLSVLNTAYENVPSEVNDCVLEYESELAAVRRIRNSALHLEDRLRRVGPGKKKIDPRVPLSFSNLENNFLCYTVEDGSVQKIEIAEKNLSLLIDWTKRVLNSFIWEGSPMLVP